MVRTGGKRRKKPPQTATTGQGQTMASQPGQGSVVGPTPLPLEEKPLISYRGGKQSRFLSQLMADRYHGGSFPCFSTLLPTVRSSHYCFILADEDLHRARVQRRESAIIEIVKKKKGILMPPQGRLSRNTLQSGDARRKWPMSHPGSKS